MTGRGRAVLGLGLVGYVVAWVFGSRALYPVATGLVAAVALAAGLYGMGPRPASADLMFDLTAGNSGLNGYTGPFAQVDVHLTDSTHATVTCSSLTYGGNIYLQRL